MESDNTFPYLFQHTASILHRFTDQIMQERLGIGMAQFKILKVLQERPGVQQRFLADSWGQTEASISRQVKLLQQKGLVTVQTNPHNRREHLMHLTNKGGKFTDAAHDIVDGYHSPVFAKLSVKEREQFSHVIQLVHQYCCPGGAACELSPD